MEPDEYLKKKKKKNSTMLKTLCSNETYFNNCWGARRKEDEPEWKLEYKLEYKTKASESIATFRHM